MNAAVTPCVQGKPKRKPESNKINFDRLCKLLDVWTLEKWDDKNIDSFYVRAEDLGLDSELTEDQADEACMKAEQEARDEAWGQYYHAVRGVADDLFAEHGLLLVPARPKKWKHWTPESALDFRIEPKESWLDACSHLLQTINGCGPFYWPSIKEFILSDDGKYKPRSTVLSHLGWLPDWYKVYGESNAQSRVERRCR